MGDDSRHLFIYPGEGGVDNLRLEPEQISSFRVIPKIRIQIGLSGLSLACKAPKSRLYGIYLCFIIPTQLSAFWPFCVIAFVALIAYL